MKRLLRFRCSMRPWHITPSSIVAFLIPALAASSINPIAECFNKQHPLLLAIKSARSSLETPKTLFRKRSEFHIFKNWDNTLPPFSNGMMNVTADRSGYKLLPDGTPLSSLFSTQRWVNDQNFAASWSNSPNDDYCYDDTYEMVTSITITLSNFIDTEVFALSGIKKLQYKGKYFRHGSL